jgi:hypothetical protein
MSQESDGLVRSREDLQRYLDHFNRREHAQQVAYYAPDVRYQVGTLTLSGPQAIADFYADFHQHCREHVEIARFALTGDVCAVVMPTRFEPFRDYERYGLKFVAGTPVEIVSFIFYTLKAGRIWRIRMARYAGPAADFQEA